LLLQAPPEPKYVAFKGTGRTLGSTSESTALSQLAAPAVSTSEPPNLPFEGLVVDDTKPATSIQVTFLREMVELSFYAAVLLLGITLIHLQLCTKLMTSFIFSAV
jgi:hypothetical protein